MNIEDIARLILEGKPVPAEKKKAKDEVEDATKILAKVKKDLGVKGSGDDPDGDDKENDPADDASDKDLDGKPDGTQGQDPGPEELDDQGAPEGNKAPFKKKPKKPDMSKDPDKGSEKNPVKDDQPEEDAPPAAAKDGKPPAGKKPPAGESDAQGDDTDTDDNGKKQEPENDEDPEDKADKTSPVDGEGGTVKGDDDKGEDEELIDGSSKSEINTEPKIDDATDTDDDGKPDADIDPDSAKDPEAGDGDKKKSKGKKEPTEADDEMDPDSKENKQFDKDPKAKDKKKKKVPVKEGMVSYRRFKAASRLTEEEARIIDEISPGMAKRYTKRAAGELDAASFFHGGHVAKRSEGGPVSDDERWARRKSKNRLRGIRQATDRMTKEEVNEGEEAFTFKGTAHHSRMYKYHDDMARTLSKTLKKGGNKKLQADYDYHVARCKHHEAALDSKKPTDD